MDVTLYSEETLQHMNLEDLREYVRILDNQRRAIDSHLQKSARILKKRARVARAQNESRD